MDTDDELEGKDIRAPLTGLEPVTVGLEVQCSVHLSYRGSLR